MLPPRFPLHIVTLLSLACLAGCTPSRPGPAPRPTQAPAETRLVVQTQTVERTVVVTAEPSPTPSYVSRIDAPPDTLLYPLSVVPQTLDPQDARDDASNLLVAQIYEGLYNLRRDGSLAPAAATGYRVSADGKVYTVTLRAGLRWTGGQPVVAQDYAQGACRLLDPALSTPYSYLLLDVAPVSGAKARASGARPGCSGLGVTAVDTRTLQVTLERAVPAFPQLLASRAFLPAPRPAVDGNTVGNGPYRVSDWQPSSRVTLVKNPDYWDAGGVGIGRIELAVLPEAGDRLAAYVAGRLHVTDVAAGSVPQVLADPAWGGELVVLPQPGVSFLAFNTGTAPTDNADFRRAVASALNRQDLLVDGLHETWHTPAQTLLPASLSGRQAGDAGGGYAFNLDAARHYLAQAGYTQDNPPPVLNLWINRAGHNVSLAETIAGQLERAGIPVRVTSSSWEIYQRSLQACQQSASANQPSATANAPGCGYNAYLMGWMMDLADPERLLGDALGVRPVTVYSRWASAAYDAQLAQARAEPDPGRRMALYQAAEHLLLSDAVAVPLFYYDYPVLVKPGVTPDFPLFGSLHFQYWQFAH